MRKKILNTPMLTQPHPSMRLGQNEFLKNPCGERRYKKVYFLIPLAFSPSRRLFHRDQLFLLACCKIQTEKENGLGDDLDCSYGVY